jgi:hypothetical protein
MNIGWSPEFSAMMIHVESGECPSGYNWRDTDRWLIDHDGCYEYCALSSRRQGPPDFYRCPTCDGFFMYASGLLQHVATEACAQDSEQTISDIDWVLRGN